MARRRTLVAVGTVTALVAGLGVAQLLPGAAPIAQAEGLIPYTSCNQLLGYYRRELRETATPWGIGQGGFMAFGGAVGGGVAGGVAEDSARSMAGAAPAAQTAAKAPGDAVGSGGTGTNLQEQGVDEPDIAKLRTGRLVVLAQGRIQVVTAEADPKMVGSLRLSSPEQVYGGAELLLVGERAMVVIQGYREQRQPQQSQTDAKRMVGSYLPGTPTTRLVLVDLSTDQPRLIEEATYDAQYVSARLVGDTVRLVTTNRPQVRTTQPQAGGKAAERVALLANEAAAERLALSQVLPQVVRRNAAGIVVNRGAAVSCDQTTHAEEPAGASTLLVTTFQPGQGLGPTDRDAVTTDGDLVYASTDRLYVATSRWGTTGPVRPMPATSSTSDSPTATVEDEVSTELHGFDTSGATTRYLGTGSVPGYVMGRWALSAHEGALRVATTRQPPWQQQQGAPDQAIRPEQQPQTSSMVVKLAERDGDLVETGRVEGLGKTERIQAVRYFGDLAAVVTFRQTDPLYLIDLAGAPKVLGELKVPGFSTYLHPIGDGRLLGLGQEADEQGRVTGVQMSVFDINDLSKPTQVDRLQLGQGHTPAMDDSRAFTYDPGRRLAVFAFQSYDPTGRTQGEVGALGISVSATGQLSELGRMPVAVSTPTQRVLVDAERLYAVSDSGVAAGNPTTMTRTGSVNFDRY